jgi:hypothetical protein
LKGKKERRRNEGAKRAGFVVVVWRQRRKRKIDFLDDVRSDQLVLLDDALARSYRRVDRG